jgi:hypothetical protein
MSTVGVSEWVRVTARTVTPNWGAVTSSSQKPPVVEEEAQFQNMKMTKRTKIWSGIPTGPEINNDCAGEGQQQLTGLGWTGPTERLSASQDDPAWVRYMSEWTTYECSQIHA